MNPKNETSQNFRTAMRELPVPLTIVTTSTNQQQRGITLSSFTSLSADPPLVSFNIGCTSQFCQLLDEATHCAVHFPSINQAGLCNHFAVSGLTAEEQFTSVQYEHNAENIPIIKEVSTVMECRIGHQYKVNDHRVVIAQVINVDNRGHKPGLLYCDKSFRTIEPHLFKSLNV